MPFPTQTTPDRKSVACFSDDIWKMCHYYYIGCSVVSAAAHNHKVSYRLISSGVYVFISWSRVCVCVSCDWLVTFTAGIRPQGPRQDMSDAWFRSSL